MHLASFHRLKGQQKAFAPYNSHFKANWSSVTASWGKISFLLNQAFPSIRLIGGLAHLLIITTNICRLAIDESSSHPIMLNHLWAVWRVKQREQCAQGSWSSGWYPIDVMLRGEEALPPAVSPPHRAFLTSFNNLPLEPGQPLVRLFQPWATAMSSQRERSGWEGRAHAGFEANKEIPQSPRSPVYKQKTWYHRY